MMVGAESETQSHEVGFGEIFQVEVSARHPAVLVVCEHASNRIPAALDGLGLSKGVAQSHVAWDPGALGVAQSLAKSFPSVLIRSKVSRLVYDCNRPPDAESAIPAKSEVFDIPGNMELAPDARTRRVKNVYEPFSKAIADQIAQHRETLQLMVTVHSFTPVFKGKSRAVEVGILHGQDARFAQAMMDTQPKGVTYTIRLNEPYSAEDGVTHTLDKHGVANGLLNVMIEVRNDLLGTVQEQHEIGTVLASWIAAAQGSLRAGEGAL